MDFFSGIKENKYKLIFHGVPPEPLELEVIDDPDITRDILETMIKCIFRDMLKIKRIVPLTQVYRHSSLEAEKIKPIVVGFLHIKDKESILPQCVSSRILKQRGIYVTEDFVSSSPQKTLKIGSPKKALNLLQFSPTKAKKQPNIGKDMRALATTHSMRQHPERSSHEEMTSSSGISSS